MKIRKLSPETQIIGAINIVVNNNGILRGDNTDFLINATSVGLYPNVDQKPDINYDSVRSGMVVCDVIFNDPNSLFLREPADKGAETVNGLGMLVNQGTLNFKLWTGCACRCYDRDAPPGIRCVNFIRTLFP